MAAQDVLHRSDVQPRADQQRGPTARRAARGVRHRRPLPTARARRRDQGRYCLEAANGQEGPGVLAGVGRGRMHRPQLHAASQEEEAAAAAATAASRGATPSPGAGSATTAAALKLSCSLRPPLSLEQPGAPAALRLYSEDGGRCTC